jgi:hypothetical protein
MPGHPDRPSSAFLLRAIAIVVASAAVSAAPAGATAPKRCGSVSYTFPHTHNHGHAALNNLTAVGVSCADARIVARRFLSTGKAVARWTARMTLVTVHINGHRYTEGEEIFTNGRARVTGEVAN